jgi:hypothetical protein
MAGTRDARVPDRRGGRLLRLGSSALVLVGLMLAGSVVLWVAIPVLWLWVASRIESATGSLGAAVGVAFVGVVVSIALMVPVLSWLSNKHREQRVARGYEDTGHLALEVVIVTSAGVAVAAFGAWFLLLSGSSPIPFTSSG